MNDRATLRLAIRGHVQGVGFRYSMHEEARRLGLSGWVRNRRDGSVEALVQGPAAAVEGIRRWAMRGRGGNARGRRAARSVRDAPDSLAAQNW